MSGSAAQRGVVIVGAGECGARAALALRERGFTGPVTLVGGEDVAPYERPPLSKEVLVGVDEPAPTFVGPVDGLRAAGIEPALGVAAVEIDRDAHEVVLADGRRLGYGRLLLATGATARRLGVPGAHAVRYLRSFADAVALRRELRPGVRVGIVGGGFIGLELAAATTARGCSVTVVEAAPGVLGRVVPPDIAATVAQRHRRAGVNLRCGTGVAEVVTRAGGSVAIVLADGGAVECDIAVAGVGAVPDTELAEKAGLELENGIRADAHLVTSDPEIATAGDCCSFPHPLYGGRRIRLEAWRNAQDQGTAVAGTLLGEPAPFAAVPWFWSDQYELTLQIAGLPAVAATRVRRCRADGVEIEFGLAADGRVLSAAAIGTGNAVAKDIKLATMLVERRATPDPDALGDPAVPLKALLRAT